MRAYLSLGSNVGDRALNLGRAVEAMRALGGVNVCRVSRVYTSEPVGLTNQPEFLNLAVEIETALGPLELLNAVKAIETALGRVPTEPWGPRVIDIDIVLYGDRIVSTDTLSIPHKEFRNRLFVLIPLREIAPNAIDPVSGLTVSKLAESPHAQGRVEAIQC
jgi:2-amino-4-hydroxy-6-hydroxymethyldihydropteridine diphosphokinase